MPHSAVLLDVGGVIFTSLEPDESAIRRDALAQKIGLSSGSAMWNHFYGSEEWQATKTGHMVEAEMWRRLLEPFGFNLESQRKAFLGELFADEGVEPAMVELLKKLRQRYRLGILSNASDRLEDLLRRRGVYQFFTTIVNSHRIGVAKPDPGAFEIAVQRIGARPQEIYFTDDQERNTRVAAGLGLTVHRFVNVQQLAADLEQRGLL